nr:hypothetical protein [Tanacetum cinerariifolium]
MSMSRRSLLPIIANDHLRRSPPPLTSDSEDYNLLSRLEGSSDTSNDDQVENGDQVEAFGEADAALKANILDFCEDHYEDILPFIMDKVRRDKRKEVHARLDFEENPRKSRRVREGSQKSSVGTFLVRYRNPLERPKMRDRLKYNDGDVFDRLGHRRQSAFDQLSNYYSPSTTKSGPNEENSRDRSHSRGRSHRQGSSSRDRPQNKNRPRGIEESYGNACSSYRAWDMHGYHARNRDDSRSMKRGRESESSLSRVSKSGTSDGGH